MQRTSGRRGSNLGNLVPHPPFASVLSTGIERGAGIDALGKCVCAAADAIELPGVVGGVKAGVTSEGSVSVVERDGETMA